GSRIEQRLHLGADAPSERNLDVDDRLLRERVMKEAVTPAVRLQPAAQIVPSLNLVDGLVLDQLFEDRSRRAPVNLPQLEQPAVESGLEQSGEAGIDRTPVGVRVEVAE